MSKDPNDLEDAQLEQARPAEPSAEPREPSAEPAAEAMEDDEPVETPFDHPLFLPIVLLGLSLWFFWDGFINQDPEMLEHLTFNRGGFTVLSLATLWFGYKGLKEMRERSDEDSPTE